MKTNKQPTHAYILAAGQGTRMQPFTAVRPKPLMEVLGRTLLEHAVERCLNISSIHTIILNSHHLHPSIEQFTTSLLEKTYPNIRFHVVHEPSLLGTGGGLLNMWNQHRNDDNTALVFYNGDAMIELELSSMLQFYQTHETSGVLALRHAADASAYGTIGTDIHNRIVTFVDRIKPLGTPTQHRMFCGVHIVSPDVLAYLPQGESCINQNGYPALLNHGGILHGFDVQGHFFDVGTPKRLWQANITMLEEAIQKDASNWIPWPETSKGCFISPTASIHPQATITAPCLIADNAHIDKNASIGPGSIIGKRASIHANVNTQHCVVMADTTVHRSTHHSVWCGDYCVEIV
jgi:mannose-1-phosphate guanylyltransferase